MTDAFGSEPGAVDVTEDGGRTAAFALLGLAADADERALKAAYARRLKSVRPETDPEGFQALRAAYERLRGTLAVPDPGAIGGEPIQGADRSAENEGDRGNGQKIDPAARDDLLHRFDARRRRGDAAGALAIIDAALSGRLDLAWRGAVEDALFDRLARDPSVRPDLLQGLAARFDWREARTRQEERDPEAFAALRGRIEAFDLADALRARAEAVRRGEGVPGDAVLLRLLGPYRVGLFDRGLDEAERTVAVEVINAVIGPLAEIDGLVDPRTLAALRGVLGGAPLVGAPPAAIEPAAAASQAVGGAPINPPGKWNWSVAGLFWIGILLLSLLGRVDWGGERPATRPAPITRTANPAPPVAMSFPIRKAEDGRLGLDLARLLDDDARSVLRAVRINAAGKVPVTVSLERLAGEPIRFLPQGERKLQMEMVFRDGRVTDLFEFDLVEPGEAGDEAGTEPRQEAAEDAAREPDGRAEAASRPSSQVRFAPSLVRRDGRLFVDLTAALAPENRPALRAIGLTPAPGRKERILDWAALEAAPLQEIPGHSERMTLRILLRDDGNGRTFVFNPREALARFGEADRAAPPPAPSLTLSPPPSLTPTTP